MTTTQQEVPSREAAPAAEAPKLQRTRAPRVDVAETPDAFFITADVPGVAMDAIDVTIEENRLEFTAERTPVTHEELRPAVRQYREGGYARTFAIPETVERANVRADLRDGVLRITLPKAQPVQPQKVQVQVGSASA
ncbi:MAG: Hsp20/alpha crystallin family protein [Candidatus Binatia bacterium]|nr:Hsp20/alpha crystallin family protein [Candidatus Binatia bacterium]